jgi:hypothetical protein
LRFREATRLIEMKFHLTPKENIRLLQPLGPVAANPLYPSLYFAGSSMGVNGQEAAIEGVVRMEPDGTVRWQFVRASFFRPARLIIK